MIIIATAKDDEPVTVSTIINTGFDQNDKIVYCNSKTYAERIRPNSAYLSSGHVMLLCKQGKISLYN